MEIKIDGSQGEGGGQIFRTSLSMAMCLGKPVRIMNIRAGRAKPGLLRQHLACLKAAQEICNAEVTGAELRSTEVSFMPGKINAGNYSFSVGSAGSTTLIFQTVLPALLRADDISEVTFEGGTHNGMAPSCDFLALSFLPVVKMMGINVELTFEHYGFYPSGGGRWKARIYPLVSSVPLQLKDRGALLDKRAVAISSQLPEHITERELRRIMKKCAWSQDSLQQLLVHSVGPGNIVSLRLLFANVQEVFEIVGEKGVTAERVAGKAIKAMNRYLHSGACVGEYLADQLLLPMALGAGGEFLTMAPSMHTRTNLDVIGQISGKQLNSTNITGELWSISLK